MIEQGASPRRNSAAAFPSTQWSAILEAGHLHSPNAAAALEKLCRTYWPPLYAFLRREGHPPQDAEDLVQGFLARVIEREDFAGVGPEKGRFRTFLLTTLRNFVIKQIEHDRALKRGGGKLPSPIQTEDAEQLCRPDLSAENPELAFDRRWCRTVLANALQRLRLEHRARNKEAWFNALAPFLDGAEPGEYAAVAAQTEMAPNAVAVAVHRMRLRLQELVRAEIAQTVASPEQVEEELRHLMAVWQR